MEYKEHLFRLVGVDFRDQNSFSKNLASMKALEVIKTLLKCKCKSTVKTGMAGFTTSFLRSSNCRSIKLLIGLAELSMGRIGRCRYARYALCMAPGPSTSSVSHADANFSSYCRLRSRSASCSSSLAFSQSKSC